MTKTDTTTQFWGDNSTGAYGDGTTNSSYNPVSTPGADDAASAPLTNQLPTRYSYDAAGMRRATTSASAGQTTYNWDQADGLAVVLSESGPTGTTSYVYGPGGYLVETIEPDGNITYAHHDALGSTRTLTDDAGNTIGTLSYDAFGAVDTASSPITPRIQFAGQYQDGTGLLYLRARYYDAATGQFLTRDPAITATRDAYGYATNSPLNNIDPSGLFDCAHDIGPCPPSASRPKPPEYRFFAEIGRGNQEEGEFSVTVPSGELDVTITNLQAFDFTFQVGINANGSNYESFDLAPHMSRTIHLNLGLSTYFNPKGCALDVFDVHIKAHLGPVGLALYGAERALGGEAIDEAPEPSYNVAASWLATEPPPYDTTHWHS